MKKIVFLFLLLINILSAQPCPPTVQAVFLTKIISYIREIKGTTVSTITIGVFNDSKNEFTNILKEATGKSNITITVKNADLSLDEIDVVYVPLGTSAEKIKVIKTTCATKKILSIAGDPQFIIDHNLTLTVKLVDNKPRMLISLESAEEESIKFSADLLKIADKK